MSPKDDDADIGCEHGRPLLTPCPECAAMVERLCAEFLADVEAGLYDLRGYTPAERRAMPKRRGQQELF